jgi:hypothetical protein
MFAAIGRSNFEYLIVERGRKSRPSPDNRQFINGMLHVLRVAAYGVIYMSDMESGTPSMSDSVARPSKGYGMCS